jgi:hypothetical protein
MTIALKDFWLLHGCHLENEYEDGHVQFHDHDEQLH